MHRIGRTGRAGREGQAFTLVTKEEAKYWKAIAALINKDIPYFDLGDSAGPDDVTRGRPARAQAAPQVEAARAQSPNNAEGRSQAARAKAARVSQSRTAEGRTAEAAPAEARSAEPRSPRPERTQPPKRTDRHPQRDVGDVPDCHSFHDGNMPAFLMRSVKVG